MAVRISSAGGGTIPIRVAPGEIFILAANAQYLYRRTIVLGAGAKIVGGAESILIGV